MIPHTELGVRPFERSRRLKLLVNAKAIKLAGNLKLKIYGKLNCASGKRMSVENRIFFESKQEAIARGFRPCGHCMTEEYQVWKASGK